MIVHFLELFLLTTTFASSTPFEENENAFERTITYEKAEPESSDFIQLISTIVNDTYQENDDTASANNLHDLRSSLNHYYLTRVFQYFAKKHKIVKESYHPDPCCLPNSHTVEYPNFYFRQVKVFGFPPLRNTKHLNTDIRFDPRSRIYSVTANVLSDVVVFTGKFNVSQDEFLFVYQTFENSYNIVRSNKLASDGQFKLKSITELFTFGDDQLTHTLDSSSDNYTEINYLLYPTLKKMIQNTYMPQLAKLTRSFLQPKIRRQMSRNASSILRKAFDQLMQQIIEYLRRRNSTRIRIQPLVFTNDRTRIYSPLNFENLTLEGILNFEKYEVVQSTTPSVNNSLIVSMQDEIVIDYPAEGSNSAYFAFTFRTGKRKSTKKFKIRRISITMECAILLDRYPPRISPRNVDGYQFSINFDVNNFDDTYTFLLNYLHNRISKVVTNAIAKNEILKPEFDDTESIELSVS